MLHLSDLCPLHARRAAEQQGSTDLLRIFGNANMDDRIDGADAAYVQGIIDEKNALTKLSDANHDGKIDSQDIDRINEIIKGEERELTVSDSIDRNVTIKMPVKSLIALGSYRNEAAKILNAQDMMVGVSSDIIQMKYYYPELADKPPLAPGLHLTARRSSTSGRISSSPLPTATGPLNWRRA